MIYGISGPFMHNSFFNVRSLVLAFLLLVGLIVLPLTSFATIVGSRHDLSAGMGAAYNHNLVFNNYGQVCVYCHTPHDSNKDNGGKLLWNKPFLYRNLYLVQFAHRQIDTFTANRGYEFLGAMPLLS